MPLVQVRVSDESSLRSCPLAVDKLMTAIPQAVAISLSCDDPDGRLTPEEFEVEVIPTGIEGLNFSHVGITVIANDYPSRRANLRNRRIRLQRFLRPHIPEGASAYLWVVLCPGSFGPFGKEEEEEDPE